MNPSTTGHSSAREIGLARTRDGITVCTLDPRGVERIGTFRSPAAAWAAIDQLDAPVGG